MKIIPLTKGYSTMVDDDQYERLSQYKWHVQFCKNRKGEISIIYAVSTRYDENRKLQTVYMHRDIMGITEKSIKVDHEDHNGLNNCRENLRVCEHRDNMRNRRVPTSNTSGFKGVTWYPKDSRWYAQIHCMGKHHHLGSFPGTEEGKLMAAKAYEEAAKIFHAEFACFDIRGTAIGECNDAT